MDELKARRDANFLRRLLQAEKNDEGRSIEVNSPFGRRMMYTQVAALVSVAHPADQVAHESSAIFRGLQAHGAIKKRHEENARGAARTVTEQRRR